MNMINNAIDAMPEGGTLRIATAREIDHRGGEWVRVDISDTGVGIAEEHLGRIFDPFFSTKEEEKRTGLGLAISYGIIRDHGGRIEVSSTVGKGTTFRLHLAVAEGA